MAKRNAIAQQIPNYAQLVSEYIEYYELSDVPLEAINAKGLEVYVDQGELLNRAQQHWLMNKIKNPSVSSQQTELSAQDTKELIRIIKGYHLASIIQAHGFSGERRLLTPPHQYY